MNAYPSIFNFGHRAIRDLLSVPVMIQEKVDGSQFTFGRDAESGELFFRSKRVNVHPEDAGMFKQAVEAVMCIAGHLTPGYIYRGEYLQKPHHNTLTYNRVPNGHVILFDIQKSVNEGDYLTYDEMTAEAARLGFEVVPCFAMGKMTIQDLPRFLERESILGGPKVEGIVVKQIEPTLWGTDKKPLVGKFVSADFQEQHRQHWGNVGNDNTSPTDILVKVAAQFRTEARWRKSVQHLREAGVLTDSPKDIGALLRETNEDLLRETSDDIKDALFKWAIKRIQREVTRGLPEWYKEQLLADTVRDLSEAATGE